MTTGHKFEMGDKLSPEQVVSVRSAPQAVISSDIFAGSKRCQDFLRLVVEHALAGELDALPERMIGVEMFGRPVDYDTWNNAAFACERQRFERGLHNITGKPSSAPAVRIEDGRSLPRH